jgi:hypothetical protein
MHSPQRLRGSSGTNANTCRVCGCEWIRRPGKREGRPPAFCPRCRDFRRYLGQLERLVLERPWVGDPEQERLALRRRLNAVRNRVSSGWTRDVLGRYVRPQPVNDDDD